jgi:hypothetical protein
MPRCAQGTPMSSSALPLMAQHGKMPTGTSAFPSLRAENDIRLGAKSAGMFARKSFYFFTGLSILIR